MWIQLGINWLNTRNIERICSIEDGDRFRIGISLYGGERIVDPTKFSTEPLVQMHIKNAFMNGIVDYQGIHND